MSTSFKQVRKPFACVLQTLRKPLKTRPLTIELFVAEDNNNIHNFPSKYSLFRDREGRHGYQRLIGSIKSLGSS